MIAAFVIAWHIAGLANYIAAVLEEIDCRRGFRKWWEWPLLALICMFFGFVLLPLVYYRMRPWS